ncbi:Protein of unknown function [Burkholderia sp. OK233]|nr:Protein of unknown function [Burkholderia sp. OK233]
MKVRLAKVISVGAMTAMSASVVHAFTFNVGPIQGNFDSAYTAGLGYRLQSPSCSLTGDPGYCGGSANTAQWANGDDGDLNYKKNSLYTAYLKGTNELYLDDPSLGAKFLARATYFYDFAAANTNRTELSSAAYAQMVRNIRLLDLWAEKDFTLHDESAHVRVGNQVVNWGESLFLAGGINATNAYDYQKLLIPGTQLKEAVLPAPMIEFESGLGHGLSVAAYYQLGWNKNIYPAVGSYFSANDTLGNGAVPLSVSTVNGNVGGLDGATIAGNGSRSATGSAYSGLVNGAYTGAPYYSAGVPVAGSQYGKNSGQYGVSFHYKPTFVQADFGFYYLKYNDKSPVLNITAAGQYQYQYLNDRQLLGLSTNFQFGDWAIGGELAYRPHDAVSLSACYGANGPINANTNAASGYCPMWEDKKNINLDITALLSITPANYPIILKALGGADTANLSLEFGVTKFPGISSNAVITRSVNGQTVQQIPAAGYTAWLNSASSGSATPVGVGTSTSAGMVLDFNWTYDGSLIHGWQITPGVTYSRTLAGNTPTFTANYLQDVSSLNVYLLFNQNPTVWQAGINVTVYMGPKPYQYYADRSFVGAFVTRNF